MSTVISRSVEIDAGHRVPDHGSKCRFPHGHRYRVVLEVVGPVTDERGNAQDGMVIDFGCMADLLAKIVHEPCDHAFIVAAYDEAMLSSLHRLGDGARVVSVDFPPTAERLAAWWGEQLLDALPFPLCLAALTVWETPKSSATWRPT